MLSSSHQTKSHPHLPTMDPHLIVVPVHSPENHLLDDSMIVRVTVTENDDEVKIEQVKEEELKEEQHIATVVTVYNGQDDIVAPAIGPLGTGEIPSGYETKQDRKQLLNSLVTKFSNNNQHIRFDLLGRGAQDFVDGKIDGLFETYVVFSVLVCFLLTLVFVFSHLIKVLHEEVKATNKRTSRRRTRKQRKLRARRAV